MSFDNFDPNGTGQSNGNYFGLPFNPEESRVVLLSIPWDVTVSYGDGTSLAPEAIIKASTQLDLYDPSTTDSWREGIATIEIDNSIRVDSNSLREQAIKVIDHLENGGDSSDIEVKEIVDRVNFASDGLNSKVEQQVKQWLDRGKLVGLVGGDHSTPFGAIKAIAEHEGDIGVLQIDAHADLRVAYEGFKYSHASIMYNVVNQIPQVSKLVQVAVRDLCDSEAEMADKHEKIIQYHDQILSQNSFMGISWDCSCQDIIRHLPQKVYISFDIDGLSPDNCPHTGTPVPGGISFNQATYLLLKIAESGRQIVGFDLCEVAPSGDDQWDANVGARILYKLSTLAIMSNSITK